MKHRRTPHTGDQPRWTVLGAIAEPIEGVGYVRFVQPFEQLESRGFQLRTLGTDLTLTDGANGYELDPDLFRGVSMLILPQLVASPLVEGGRRIDLLGLLCEQAARRRIPVVWSPDDWIEGIEASNPNFDKLRSSLCGLDALRRHATAIIVTTERLKATLADWDKPTFVLPNTIDPSRWAQRAGARGGPRIGWAGSSTHLDDLLLVLPALCRLRHRVAFEFTLFGLCDVSLLRQVELIRRNYRAFTDEQRSRAQRFLELHRLLCELSARHLPFVSTAQFMRTLPQLDLDIGLCPLVDSAFNRHKSALKFYEYAACGTLSVASNVEPYRTELSACTENDPQSWVEILEMFLKDRDAYQHELLAQREFVMSQRTARGWSESWADCLEHVLDPSPTGPEANQHALATSTR